MKRPSNIKLTLILCLLAFNISVKAQKVKTLKIVYDITYPTTKPFFKANCYNSAIKLYQGSKSLSKTTTEYDDISTSISPDCGETVFNSQSNLPIIIKINKDDHKKVQEELNIKSPTISVSSETKEILGYACKEIIYKTGYNEKSYTSYFYVCEYNNPNYCINSSTCSGVVGINGLMLGCVIDMSHGSIQVWTAKSITEENIDSSYFDIPSNYTIMTLAEEIHRISTDKAFRKQFKELSKRSDDGKKALRKDLWNSFPKELLQVTVQATQQIDASHQMQNNFNSQTLNSYTNIVVNNNTKSSEDAIKENNEILANSTTNITNNSQANSESSAINSGNQYFNKNAGASKKCADDTQNSWKLTNEYINYINNPGCNKMAYISQKKLAEMLLQSCRQYLPQAEIDGFNKTISSLQTTINGMEDCRTY